MSPVRAKIADLLPVSCLGRRAWGLGFTGLGVLGLRVWFLFMSQHLGLKFRV